MLEVTCLNTVYYINTIGYSLILAEIENVRLSDVWRENSDSFATKNCQKANRIEVFLIASSKLEDIPTISPAFRRHFHIRADAFSPIEICILWGELLISKTPH